MAATYVTVAELRANLGIQNLYSDSVVEEVCQTAEDIIKSKLWFNRYNIIAHENTGTTGTLYFDKLTDFYVGQTIHVENAGSHYNGNKTITEVGNYYVKVTTSHLADAPKHNVIPYGQAYGETYVDYETMPAIREAAMIIAVDVWQARQMSQAGGISPDYNPSPYRMGWSLLRRVHGLIADYMAPGGLVG